jgi:hypothetical protein
VRRRPVACFLLFWTVLNMLQIGFTELTSDEGYYWFYAQHLQWGYYDHPPMIAVLIKLGGFFFGGEFGVRVFNVILSTAGLALFFSLLPEELKQKQRTYLVLLSAPLLHYLTFLVFPDGPLLFFSLLFLVLYKRFLNRKNFATAVLLGVSLALMAYSKYHGALVLLFTVAANPKLLKSGYFYLSLVVAALLFAPHLWWQYKEGFPTLKYHLSGRTGQWSFRHIGEYVSQQLVAIGPGLIFIPFVCRTTDVFERTLKVIITGTFAFFLLSSFKTFVHFHWTSIAVYPLLYFAVGYYNRPQKTKLFRWLILPFVVLFFIARFLLAVPVIEGMRAGEDVYHGRKAWAKKIASVAGNKPVFLPNNLREASLYSFYSGKMGVTLYNRPEKKSQYELWGYEDSLQGREVLFVSKDEFAGSSVLKTSIGETLYYQRIPSFRSYYTGLSDEILLQNFRSSDSVLNATVKLVNERKEPLAFTKGIHGEVPELLYLVEQNNRVAKAGLLQDLSTVVLPSQKGVLLPVQVPVSDLPKGNYSLLFGIRSGVLPDAILAGEKTFEITH